MQVYASKFPADFKQLEQSSVSERSLKFTAIRRGGQTSRYTDFETNSIKIATTEAFKSISAQFSIRSKGGGITVIDITIQSGDFHAIIESMIEADRQSTLSAICVELTKQIGEQPIRDAALITEGRRSLRRKAQAELRAAPAEGRAAAQLALETVDALIHQMEREEQPTETAPKGRAKRVAKC